MRLTAVTLGALVALGLHALAYFRWLSHQRQRLRLIGLRIAHRRRVARLRRERRELIRRFAQAQREWRAARAEPVAS